MSNDGQRRAIDDATCPTPRYTRWTDGFVVPDSVVMKEG